MDVKRFFLIIYFSTLDYEVRCDFVAFFSREFSELCELKIVS